MTRLNIGSRMFRLGSCMLGLGQPFEAKVQPPPCLKRLAGMCRSGRHRNTTQTGTAMLVTGTPGIGKTRMLDLAEHYGRRRGLTVARGKCRPHDRPFGAFVGVYRDLKVDNPPAILEDAFGRGSRSDHWERYPVIAAFRDVLVKAAPCVVVLDELEKADPATVELLEYLVRNTLDLATAPILYVLAYECEPNA